VKGKERGIEGNGEEMGEKMRNGKRKKKEE